MSSSDDLLSLPEPTAEDIGAARRWATAFEERLRRATTLRALRFRAEILFATAPAVTQAGFGALLAQLLPADDAEFARVAEAIRPPVGALRQVAGGDLAAIEVSPEAMVALLGVRSAWNGQPSSASSSVIPRSAYGTTLTRRSIPMTMRC